VAAPKSTNVINQSEQKPYQNKLNEFKYENKLIEEAHEVGIDFVERESNSMDNIAAYESMVLITRRFSCWTF